MQDSISQRLCKKCNTSFPLSPEFWYKDKKAVHGLSYICKGCAKAKSRQWHGDNREYAKERHAQYYLENIEIFQDYRAKNAEKIAQQKHAWRQNNPDKVAEQKKRHAKRHQSKINTYHRKWYAHNRKRITENITPEQRAEASKRACAWAKANPEKVIEYTHRRRARLAGNGGDGFTKADKELQLRSQKGLCWWCGKEMDKDVTIDHIVPIKRGGPHDPRNIVLAHRSCNCSKKDKLPHEWSNRLF